MCMRGLGEGNRRTTQKAVGDLRTPKGETIWLGNVPHRLAGALDHDWLVCAVSAAR